MTALLIALSFFIIAGLCFRSVYRTLKDFEKTSRRDYGDE